MSLFRGTLLRVPEQFTGKPLIQIIARAHSDEDVAYLEKLGADHVIMGEREIAARMVSLLKAP